MEVFSQRQPLDGQREDELRALVGRVVDGRYRVVDLLGTGGVGAVYEADHLGLGRKVAIKFIDREYAQVGSVASRFTREARAVGCLQSDHIVSVHDTGSSDGRPYLVMELLRGEDLGRRLHRCGKLSVAETLHIAAQTLRGLADAHEAGIVHRDLKPDNLFLVSRKSDHSFVKIVDFGMSKVERGNHGVSFITRAGTVIGTPLYMSPEQAQAAADVDARADLYSLGAILFECITGRPPHVGEGYEQIILSICMNDAPDLRVLEPRVPVEVARLVERALRRDRARRFVSARQMLVAVTTLPGYAAAPVGARAAVAVDAGAVAAVDAVKAEPVAAKTLLAGGAAEPVREGPLAAAGGCPAQDLPVRTVLLAAPPRAEAPPALAALPSVPPPVEAAPARAEAPSSPFPAPATKQTRKAPLILAGILVALTGAAITTWVLPKLFAAAQDPSTSPVNGPSDPNP